MSPFVTPADAFQALVAKIAHHAAIAAVEELTNSLPSSHPISSNTVCSNNTLKAPTPTVHDDDSVSSNSSGTRDVSRFHHSATHLLCQAIVSGDMEKVTRYLKAAPSLAQKKHDQGWYPLHAAVLTRNPEMVQLILSQPGVDVRATDDSKHTAEASSLRKEALGALAPTNTTGATALHYACMVGSSDIIEMLLKAGASPSKEDGSKKVPLEYFNPQTHLEEMGRYTELCEKKRKADKPFEDSSDQMADAVEAIRERNLDVFKSHLEHNAELAKKTSKFRFTLLHMTCMHELPEFVDVILSINKRNDQTSNLDYRDDRDDFNSDESLDYFAPPALPHKHVRRCTALHYVCLTRNITIAKSLLEAGADWKVQDWRYRKPEEVIYDKDSEESRVFAAEYRRLCEEEVAKQKKRAEEQEEIKRKQREEARKQREKEEEARRQREEEIRRRRREEEEAEEEARKKAKLEAQRSDEEDSDHDSENDDDEDEDRINNDEENQEDTPEKEQPPRPIEVVIGEKIIGQRGPVRSVANAVRLRKNGWVDPDRPLVMLFLGSSGVGKTEVAKQLALYLHDKSGVATDKGQSIRDIEKSYGFIRVDMSEYQQDHTVANLYGSPKGYVGYEEGGYLTTRLRKNPKAIVLLDEIEKAHPDVLTLFLQVFDDGRLTDTKYGVIDCKEAIFIMTSNTASGIIKDNSTFLRNSVDEAEKQGRPEEYLLIVRNFNRTLYPTLKGQFQRDEFLGRINQIIVFLPLNIQEITIVVEGELNMWRRRSSEKHKISLTWTSGVVHKLAQSYDLNYGVRSVVNEVQHIAVQLLADAQIRGVLIEGIRAHFKLDTIGDIVLVPSDGSSGRNLPYAGCVYHTML